MKIIGESFLAVVYGLMLLCVGFTLERRSKKDRYRLWIRGCVRSGFVFPLSRNRKVRLRQLDWLDRRNEKKHLASLWRS